MDIFPWKPRINFRAILNFDLQQTKRKLNWFVNINNLYFVFVKDFSETKLIHFIIRYCVGFCNDYFIVSGVAFFNDYFYGWIGYPIQYTAGKSGFFGGYQAYTYLGTLNLNWSTL